MMLGHHAQPVLGDRVLGHDRRRAGRGRPAIQGQSLPRELCVNISNTERANDPNILEQEEDVTP
jgi:hypothetical protein